MKPGHLNASLDHLSKIEISNEPTNLEEGLPVVQIFTVSDEDNHFINIIQNFVFMIKPGRTFDTTKEGISG